MSDGKWFNGLSAPMPVVEAARVVVPARLKTVLHFLPLAVETAAKDMEHVHQLRVATRRAGAALRVFADCLPARQFQKLRKLLRTLRRAAGAARDWDVFLVHLQETPSLKLAPARPALDLLLGFTAAQRLKAQLDLIEIAPTENKNLAEFVTSLTELPDAWERADQHQLLGELASGYIKSLVDGMNTKAALAPSEYEELHRLRIFGKRLRYSMEIFADCFKASFREEIYPALEQIQEILGCITDAHVAVERITSIRDHMKSFHPTDWVRYQKPIESLLQSQRRVFPRERKRFLVWWPKWVQLTSDLPKLAN